jgi:Dyp-type peroxidase family
MNGDAHLPGNDFLIRPIEVSETQLVFDVTLTPRPGRAQAFAAVEGQVAVEIAATAKGRRKKIIKVELDPVSHEFPLREIDFRDEARKALAPGALTGYVVPPYDRRRAWPSGRAAITHLSRTQTVEWKPPLKRGTELRIDFPVVETDQVETMRESGEPLRQLVVYVEASAKEEPPAPVDPEAFAGLPLRTSTEIQGNILAGFNKDCQMFLFLRFTDRAKARQWLRQLTPEEEGGPPKKITMTEEVTRFKDRLRNGREGTDPEAEYIQSDWRNLSFTHTGIKMLQPELADELERGGRFEAFREGSAARNEKLGDLGDSHPDRWVLTETVHAVLTLAADDHGALERAVTEQLDHADTFEVEVLHEQRGDALPGPLRGREHFGFRDGVSQPGVEGYTRPADGPDGPENADHPGARIVPSRHFLLEVNEPAWMRGGTFQVLRLLGQDVARWSTQVLDQAQDLPEYWYVAPALLAAKLIGRWPSGTPISLEPRRDDRPQKSAGDNQFSFAEDEDGERCPRFAHIRTQNPRQGAKDDEHRILRRGIPFGPVYDPVHEAAGGYAPYDDQVRGLCFNAFMADIENQFEFLQKRSIVDDPDPPDTVAGGKEGSYELRVPVAQGAPADPEARPLTLRSCVKTLYSVYAFAPTLDGLKALAK